MNYYSDILDGPHCVYGFLTRESALKCMEFLVQYKTKYKRYPYIGQARKTKYSGTADHVLLEEDYLEDMKNKCVLNGVHLIGIHTFDYSFQFTDEVKLSGSILTQEYKVEQEYIKENLEYLFTFSS